MESLRFFFYNKPENRRKKQGNDLHCWMTLHHRLSSSFPGVPRVPCQQRPLVPGNRLAEGKETTDNQGQLQASAAIPRGGRTVEGRICLDIKRVNLL